MLMSFLKGTYTTSCTRTTRRFTFLGAPWRWLCVCCSWCRGCCQMEERSDETPATVACKAFCRARGPYDRATRPWRAEPTRVAPRSPTSAALTCPRARWILRSTRPTTHPCRSAAPPLGPWSSSNLVRWKRRILKRGRKSPTPPLLACRALTLRR